MAIMRLDKALSMTGMTRAEARKAVAAGRVQVNGTAVRDPGCKAEPADILLDGQHIDAPEHIYVMLNKPAGIVTATEDSRWQTVLSLMPEHIVRRRPGPVGRLDRDVTGLVLLTDDGQLAHRLISPKTKAEKVYLAECEGALDADDAALFASGMALSDFTAKPAKLDILSSGDTSRALVTLTEGKFHQVKRMFAAAGHPLSRLKRLSIGGVKLDESLGEGEWRMLSDEEVEILRAVR